MTPAWQGAVAGLAFGLASVALMAPMAFPDKRRALAAAFVERFGIGLVIGCVALPAPGWWVGGGFGLLLSLPSALITKAYVPILVLGTLGGAIIGAVIHGAG
jgi:hypothetical protein